MLMKAIKMVIYDHSVCAYFASKYLKFPILNSYKMV